MDLKEIDILGPKIFNHWYYKSKAKALLDCISDITPFVILDIGSGSGYFSKYLLKNSTAHSAYCVDINYKENSEELYEGKKIFYKKYLNSKINANLVILIDVLEHVDDDVGLLKDYMDLVPSGAKFLISVPAFQFMWSDHDIFLEHKRRYNIRSLEKIVSLSGLTIYKTTFFFAIIFPIILFIRLLKNLFYKAKTKPESNLKIHNSIVNYLLTLVCLLEIPFFKYNRLFGLSAICIAEKK